MPPAPPPGSPGVTARLGEGGTLTPTAVLGLLKPTPATHYSPSKVQRKSAFNKHEVTFQDPVRYSKHATDNNTKLNLLVAGGQSLKKKYKGRPYPSRKMILKLFGYTTFTS